MVQIQKSLLTSAHFFCLQIISVTSNAQNLKSSEWGWKNATKAEMMKMQLLFWSVLKDNCMSLSLTFQSKEVLKIQRVGFLSRYSVQRF